MNEADENNALDVFGKFLIENIRDAIICEAEGLISGKSFILSSYRIREKLIDLEPEEVNAVKDLVTEAVDAALSAFLFDFQYEQDKNSEVKIMVGQVDLSSVETNLRSELITDEEGWIERFSEYKSS